MEREERIFFFSLFPFPFPYEIILQSVCNPCHKECKLRTKDSKKRNGLKGQKRQREKAVGYKF